MSEKIPVKSGETGSYEKDEREIPGSPQSDIESGHDQPAKLTRALQGRHMQMIAIGKTAPLNDNQGLD
jgi:amino acid permease